MVRFRLLAAAVAVTMVAGVAAVTARSSAPPPDVAAGPSSCELGALSPGCGTERAEVADAVVSGVDHEVVPDLPEPAAVASAAPADETVPAPPPEEPAEAAVPSPLRPLSTEELRGARLQSALEGWMAEHADVGSAAVAIEVADGLESSGSAWAGHTVGDGSEDVDSGAPFPIKSVTKTFTEALVLSQASAGRIDLDAPMPSGIAGITSTPDTHAAITPRMLLQHTSGLVNYMDAGGYDPSAEMSPALAVSLSLESPLLAEPGAQASYSNSNFHWLGLLLEHVTDRPFADLVADLTAAHDLPSTHLDPTDRPGWTGYASGGVRSTVGDVVHWGAQLFVPGAVLTPEALAEYLHVGSLGVGLGVWPVCPCATDPHDGRVDYTAIGQIVADGGMLFFPDERLVVAVRMERVPGDVGTMTADLAGRLRDAIGIGPVAIRAA